MKNNTLTSEGPWKTRQWFVSPWNYADDVCRSIQLPERIEIHDVTLRDGEQQAGVVFNREDKIRIAEKLAEAGVHRIEAGMPAVSRDDAQAITDIAKRDLGPRIFAFCRCMKADVKMAVDCGVTGVVVEIPASQHIIQNAYRWPLQKAVDLAVEATSYARECGVYVVFFPIDGTRAEITWFLNLIEHVAKYGHMDALALVDTFGVASPHAIPYFVQNVRARIDKPLEAHFHNDFGLAAANTLLALASGASVAHTTVTGLGERGGNAAYEEIALALRTMYGLDVGVNLGKLCEVSRLVREITGYQVSPNRAIVGDQLFSIESGIIASWFRNAIAEEPLEVVPFHWDLVGQKPAEVVLGKNSGVDSLRVCLEKRGLGELESEKLDRLLALVKETSIRQHGTLTPQQFLDLLGEVE